MKRIFALLLALIMVLSLVACSGNGEEPATNTPAAENSEAENPVADVPVADDAADDPSAEAPQKITFCHVRTGYLKEVLDSAIEAFTAETGIEVETVTITDTTDLTTKFSLMMQDPETCPDVIMEDGFRVKTDANAGLLANLDSYVAEWDGWDQYPDAIKAGMLGEDGSVYSIQPSTDMQIIYYDADVMEAAGLSRDWQPASWADVLDAAKALKAANADNPDFIPIVQHVNASAAEAASMRTFQTLLFGAGSKYYDAEAGKWYLDKSAVTDVLNFLNDIYNVEELGNVDVAASTSLDADVLTNYLPSHNVGMFWSGSGNAGAYVPGGAYEGLYDGLETGALKYAFIPMANGGGYTSTSGGWAWSIPELSDNKDAAWQFLSFLNNAEYTAAYAKNGMPTREDAWESDGFKAGELYEFTLELKDGLKFTHFRDSIDGYSDVSRLFDMACENVAFDILSVEEAVETLEADWTALVGADNLIVVE